MKYFLVLLAAVSFVLVSCSKDEAPTQPTNTQPSETQVVQPSEGEELPADYDPEADANEDDMAEAKSIEDLEAESTPTADGEDYVIAVDEEDQEMGDKDYTGVYSIDVAQTQIRWTGHKIGGSHTGLVTVSGGEVEVDGDGFVRGNLVVDMTTIDSTDLEGGSKEKLDTHLKGADFFDVENHPTASIEIISASPEEGFVGNMTIKGITNELKFAGNVSDRGGDSLGLTASFTIMKDDYSIAQGLKGVPIKDEIEFEVDVVYTK